MPIGMEVNLGPGDLVLDGDPAPPPQKGNGAPKFSAHIYCGQTAGWIKLALGMEVGLSPGDFMLDAGSSPLPKKGRSPTIFGSSRSCLLRPNASAWIKMLLGTEVGLGSGDIVLHGDPAHTPHKGGRAPQFSAHFYCGQTAGCIKMPLDLEVGLIASAGQLCGRWGPSRPSPKGAEPPIFGACLLWLNGCIYGSRCHLVRR